MLDASHPILTRRTNRNRRVLAIVVNGLQRFHGSEGQDIRYPVIPSGDRYRLPVEESLRDTWDYKSKYDAANYLLSWLLTAEYLVIGTERYHQARGQPLQRGTELVRFGYEQRCDGKHQFSDTWCEITCRFIHLIAHKLCSVIQSFPPARR